MIRARSFRPLWATTLLFSLAWVTHALFIEPPDDPPVGYFPPGSAAAGGTPGNAAFGGRAIPVSLVLLRRVAPPRPAVDVDYNWPPIPGIKLRISVGRRNEFGQLIPDPTLGSVSTRTAMTDSKGQILVDYIPPGPDPRLEAREPLNALVWFSDEARRAVPFEIRLWRRMETDSTPAPKLVLKDSTSSLGSYRNAIEDPSLRQLFELAVDRWNESLPSPNRDRFLRSEAHERTFFVRANQPTTPSDRLRSAYAVAEFGMAGALGITIHSERVAPRTQFHSFDPKRVTGLENVGRSFQPPMPSEAVLGTFCHELGHILGLGETTDVNSQASIMCMGRGQLVNGNFRFFVNGVTTPTRRDKEQVQAIRAWLSESCRRSPAPSPEPAPAPPVRPPLAWWAAARESTTQSPSDLATEVRFSTTPMLPALLKTGGVEDPGSRPPRAADSWTASYAVNGNAGHCTIWPTLDTVEFHDAPGESRIRRVPGIGKQLLRTPRLDRAALARTQAPSRVLLLDRQESERMPSLQSLRTRAPLAVSGVVLQGALAETNVGPTPYSFVKVDNVLWGDDIQAGQLLTVRWPWGPATYGDRELPLPKPGSRLALALTPDMAMVGNRVARSGFYLIATPQPFGIVRLDSGLTAPYPEFGGLVHGVNSQVPGFLLPRPIALFGQPTGAFLNILSQYSRADQPWGATGGAAGNLDRVLVGLGE